MAVYVFRHIFDRVMVSTDLFVKNIEFFCNVFTTKAMPCFKEVGNVQFAVATGIEKVFSLMPGQLSVW